jgi:hypothetical protein
MTDKTMPMMVLTVPTARSMVLATTTQNIALKSANHAMDRDHDDMRQVRGTTCRE